VDNNANEVDWVAAGGLLRKLDAWRQKRLAKHSTGLRGTGRMMERVGLAVGAKCPLCGEIESAEHVDIPDTDDIWDRGMEGVQTWMDREETKT
jgi:hypothetical protein